MVTAYFLTATILSIWVYFQTRTTARNIRDARDALPCPACAATERKRSHVVPAMPLKHPFPESDSKEKPAAGSATGR